MPRRPKLFGARKPVSVPLAQRLPNGLGHGLALGFFVIVGMTGIVLGGYADQFRNAFGEPKHAFGRLVGLGLDRITISGIAELREWEILAAAGITPKTSLVFLDAAETRERLEAMPLVKEASVRKLYPDELAITLVEREPAALWQRQGELFVIAADGTVIDQMRDDRFLRLPFVVGDEANLREKHYAELLDAAGPLRPRIKAGMLIAGRRWDLKLDNGIDLKLPEQGAKDALARFAALEREQRLTDRDVISIDMRMPDRVVLRLTEEAAAARADLLKKKPKVAKGAEI